MSSTSPRLAVGTHRSLDDYVGVPATLTTDDGETFDGVFDIGHTRENSGELIVLTMEGRWAFADYDRINAFEEAEHMPCTCFENGNRTKSVFLCEPTVVPAGPDLCAHGYDRHDYGRTTSVDYNGNTVCCGADETFPMDYPNTVCRCCRADVDDALAPPAEPYRVELNAHEGEPLDAQPSAIIDATADLTFNE